MHEPLRLLRYNTGTDKQAFIRFKEYFDAVIFNATIVAHSGSAVADLVSVHKQKYIIDPQTHIFQHDISAIQSKTTGKIKVSVSKYLAEMPENIREITLSEKRMFHFNDISAGISDFVSSTYKFETEYINNFIKGKSYDKYLNFAKIGPEPRLVIAPYFMIKKEYNDNEIRGWLDVNKQCLEQFIKYNNGKYPVSAQLVLDSEILLDSKIFSLIEQYYSMRGYEYVFIWVSDFNSFSATPKERDGFLKLLSVFNKLNIKPLMAYGGFDSIFLCHNEITNRLYGVSQSVGYGEARGITPVGGGIPVNKYYFLPTHQRLNFGVAADILSGKDYFSKKENTEFYANMYYKHICNCKQCREIIKKDIDNFKLYNESMPFKIKSGIMRNRPTANASLISAMHFLWCKVKEWQNIKEKTLAELRTDLIINIKDYAPDLTDTIIEWCNQYGK
jgi:hypothetical protein